MDSGLFHGYQSKVKCQHLHPEFEFGSQVPFMLTMVTLKALWVTGSIYIDNGYTKGIVGHRFHLC